MGWVFVEWVGGCVLCVGGGGGSDSRGCRGGSQGASEGAGDGQDQESARRQGACIRIQRHAHWQGASGPTSDVSALRLKKRAAAGHRAARSRRLRHDRAGCRHRPCLRHRHARAGLVLGCAGFACGVRNAAGMAGRPAGPDGLHPMQITKVAGPQAQQAALPLAAGTSRHACASSVDTVVAARCAADRRRARQPRDLTSWLRRLRDARPGRARRWLSWWTGRRGVAATFGTPAADRRSPRRGAAWI
jgi:hypothetical protein